MRERELSSCERKACQMQVRKDLFSPLIQWANKIFKFVSYMFMVSLVWAAVWNPWDKKAKSIADMGDEDYTTMLCVDSGAIETPIVLKPHEEWKGRQELSIVSSSYCSGQLDPRKVLYGDHWYHNYIYMKSYLETSSVLYFKSSWIKRWYPNKSDMIWFVWRYCSFWVSDWHTER